MESKKKSQTNTFLTFARTHFAFLLLLLILVFSWKILNSPQDKWSEEKHLELQMHIQDFIKLQIKNHFPESKNIQFKQMWTKKIDKNKIEALFSYSFEEEAETDSASVHMSISAILKKETGPGQTEIWQINDLYVLADEVNFKKGIVIYSHE